MGFIVKVSNWVWAKNSCFTLKKPGKDAWAPRILDARGALVCSQTHALGTWYDFDML